MAVPPVAATATDAGPGSIVAAPEKERRLVTILFSDLVGSTALGERLDPEEVDELVGAAQAALAEVVTQYGGHVAKFLGDGLMALFGAPVAHEDDAERAVLAALRMHEALRAVHGGAVSEPAATGAAEAAPLPRRTSPPAPWGQAGATPQPRDAPRLEMRIGITSGEVIASGKEGSYDVIGDAANTAARLQSAADVGGVLVGVETMQLARRRIRFGERRDLSLKGKASSVAAYPVAGVRERVVERWEMRPTRTPLIGRERELGLLFKAWERSQNGEGQLVTVVADAGVGKSRLVGELVEKVSGSTALQVIRGRCLSYGQDISLWLVADLLRSLCGIREEDLPTLWGIGPLAERRAQLDSTLTSLLAGLDTEGREAAIDVLGEALGIVGGKSAVAAADAQVRRQVLVRSLRALLAAVVERGPTVLVLEDLHWIDAASAEILAEIAIDVPGLRLLVLATQRPGWSAPWSEWEWPERLSLRPMDEQDTVVLAGAVLAGQVRVQARGRADDGMRLSATLQRYIRERTGGNPFFVEELLRALQETGGLKEEDGQMALVVGVADRLPSSLTEILLARLDRLEAEVRSLTQVASVIGRSFAVRLLAQIVGQEAAALNAPLTALQRAEILFPRRGVDLEYLFKHATIREVAYNTLLQKRRQQLHAATARAIASLYPSDEYVEMIAYHYSRTEEHAEAARWLERAGDRAADVYANEIAIGHYREARSRLELCGANKIAIARVEEKLGKVLTTVGQYDEALEVLAAAADTYRSAGDLQGEAGVLAQAGEAHYHRGTQVEGIAALQELLERSQDSLPPRCLASVYGSLTILFFASGRYIEQLEAAERSSEAAHQGGDTGEMARAEVSRALALLALSRREKAQQVLEGALPLAEAAGDLSTLARALDNLSNVHYFRGDSDRARLYLERGLEVAEQMGDPTAMGHMVFMLGTNAFWTGEWSTSRAYLERATTVVDALGKARISALPVYGLGQLTLHEGDWETATRYLEQACQLAEQSGNLPILKWAHRMLAERELREGNSAGALARLIPLLKRPGLEQSATLLAPLAEAHAELGNEKEAETAVAQAIARATADDDAVDLAYALRAALRLAIRQHRQDDALHNLEQALQLARRTNRPYGAADCLYIYGIMCKERGAVEEADERLQEALTIFRRLGAKKDIERTERALNNEPEAL